MKGVIFVMTRKTMVRALALYIMSTAAIVIALSASVAAQSTDRDNPTKLTTEAVAGRLTKNGEAHYYTFIGGPGEVKLLLDIAADEFSALIYAQLADADGRNMENLENPGSTDIGHSVSKDFTRIV